MSFPRSMGTGLEELRDAIYQYLNVIRVYTKQAREPADLSSAISLRHAGKGNRIGRAFQYPRALDQVDWRVPFFLYRILVAVGEGLQHLAHPPAASESAKKLHAWSKGTASSSELRPAANDYQLRF